VSLSELITAATAARVGQIERNHAAGLELDRYVREQVDVGFAKRSAVTCGCERCAQGRERTSDAATRLAL